MPPRQRPPILAAPPRESFMGEQPAWKPDARNRHHIRVVSDDESLRDVVSIALQSLPIDGTFAFTVTAMKLGAMTALERPVSVRAPRSAAERWARHVLKGCSAEGDLHTLRAWAMVAGLSYSSLCESCRLIGVQPIAARDLMRVLRAIVQSTATGCRIGETLDICDRRTLMALMSRAGVDPQQHGRDLSLDVFFQSQRLVPAGSAGLAALRELIQRGP